jgi:hypothetical protein
VIVSLRVHVLVLASGVQRQRKIRRNFVPAGMALSIKGLRFDGRKTRRAVLFLLQIGASGNGRRLTVPIGNAKD